MRRLAAISFLVLALLAPRVIFAQQAPSASPSNAPSAPAAQGKSAASQAPPATQGNPDVQVWVNTRSGVYHCPGTHWYGSTKSGEYMKQSEAQQKGFRPAYHRVCR